MKSIDQIKRQIARLTHEDGPDRSKGSRLFRWLLRIRGRNKRLGALIDKACTELVNERREAEAIHVGETVRTTVTKAEGGSHDGQTVSGVVNQLYMDDYMGNKTWLIEVHTGGQRFCVRRTAKELTKINALEALID